jgi:hypothetical protein
MEPQARTLRSAWRLDSGDGGLAGFAEHGAGDESDHRARWAENERRRHAGFDAAVEMVA